MNTKLKVEVRASKDGSQAIEGHAAVFMKRSGDLGGFVEQIRPGAFKRALAEKQDTLCLLNHDPAQLLGRTSSGTCTINEDDDGLFFRCDMPNTQLGRDTMEQIKRGDISQCSFTFRTDDDEWDEEDEADFIDPNDQNSRSKKVIVRTINSVSRLFDVSPVVSPAYPQTDVAIA